MLFSDGIQTFMGMLDAIVERCLVISSEENAACSV